MKLKSIEISNYKSIKSPVKINLSDGRLHTFIGKNGSGKTNVLKALKIALSGRLSYRDEDEEKLKAEYIYSLTDEEYGEYFQITEDNNESRKIKVSFNGKEPNVKWVTYPALEISVKEYKLRLQNLHKEFKEAAKDYLKVVEEFEGSNYGYDDFTDLTVETDGEEQSYTVFKWHIQSVRENFKNQVKELERFISSFEEDVLKVDYENSYSFEGLYPFNKLRLYKLKSGKIEMGGLTAQVLKIDKERLARANEELKQVYEKFNVRLKKERDRVNAILTEFEQIKSEIFKIYSSKRDEYYDGREELFKRQRTFRDELKRTLYPKVYLLDNEIALLFNTKEEDDYSYLRSTIRERYLNTHNPIVQSFDNYLKETGVYADKESIFSTNSLKKDRLEEIVRILNEDFLNKFKPDFDEDIRYKLEVNNGLMKMFVIEKNGEKVPFNNTSLGRRWYLTYIFVKNLLEKGDYFLIDEPAAFLHPQAQSEIFRDIKELSKKGINVFMSTHSPYLISNNWKFVYNVTMGKGGTQIEKFNAPDELCEEIHNELIGLDTKDVLFSLPKTIFFVEGTTDRVCIEKFAELLKYDLSNYRILVCDGSAIILFFHLCRQYNIKFIMMADSDNLYKAKSYKLTHQDYAKIIEEMKSCPDICYFVGEGRKGCLETLFENDKDSFIFNAKGKIDDKQIAVVKSIDEFSKETINNFKNIFKHFNIPKQKQVK